MNLIIPAAGKSSRFPGLKPKWMLTHPNGNLMVTEAIRGLETDAFERIFFVILKEHIDQYHCLEGITKAFENAGLVQKLRVVVLEKATRSQPETVARAIEQEHIEGPIFIKDSDNAFQCKVEPRNAVAIYDLGNMPHVNHPSNKSYVTLNDNEMVANIVEKQIISSLFCVGGYAFADSGEYLTVFRKIQNHENLYVSHIIYEMLLSGVQFESIMVSEYEDWGTLEDWDRYKRSFSTLFVDLDGVLLENSGEYFPPTWGETPAIKDNVDAVNALYRSGRVRIIITTTRKESYREQTLSQMEREGIKYHDIVFGLSHAKRIIVNDYAKSNPYKSCDAINIARNSTDLKEMLEESFGFPIDLPSA